MSNNTPQIDKCIDHQPPRNTCSECGHKFAPSESRSVVIRGPSEVYCGCPECGHRSLGIIPEEVAHPPDADRDEGDVIYGLSDRGDPGSLTTLDLDAIDTDEDENEEDKP